MTVIGAQKVPSHLVAGPQLGGAAGGGVAVTQEICAESGTCPAGHSSAEAGAAVMTAGTATNVVSPNIRAAKAAILRIVHLP
ncbi:MAG: hypothetical protein WCJ91_05520 [Actinomycetes bacterium]